MDSEFETRLSTSELSHGELLGTDNDTVDDDGTLQKPPARVLPQQSVIDSLCQMFASRSRFRHVYGSPAPRDQCFEGLHACVTTHDTALCAVNTKYLAVVVESTGGGVFIVLPLNKPGRVDANISRICGHSAQINDIKWNPFNENVIATCSDDTTIRLWSIPEGGLTYDTENSLSMELSGHSKRVNQCHWHPSAADVLLSTGSDFKCFLWNTSTGTAVKVISLHNDVIFSAVWNRNGSQFATTSKDGYIRVIEPRSGKLIATGCGHSGTGKASKLIYVQGPNRLLSTGFSKTGERQYALWEVKGESINLLKLEDIDSSSSLMTPYYDSDTHITFLAGKGDGNIRYYEVTSDPPYTRSLNQYQSPSPQRDLALMPKLGVDPGRGEICRFYKLHATKDLCEPISMIFPRRTDRFQTEVYPPTASNKPALTADQWFSGVDKDPLTTQLVDLNDNTLINFTTTEKTTVITSSVKPATGNSLPKEAAVMSRVEKFEMTPRQLRNDDEVPAETGKSAGVTTMIRQYERISSTAGTSVGQAVDNVTSVTSTSSTPATTWPADVSQRRPTDSQPAIYTFAVKMDLNAAKSPKPEADQSRSLLVGSTTTNDGGLLHRSLSENGQKHVHFADTAEVVVQTAVDNDIITIADVTFDDSRSDDVIDPDEVLVKPSSVRHGNWCQNQPHNATVTGSGVQQRNKAVELKVTPVVESEGQNTVPKQQYASTTPEQRVNRTTARLDNVDLSITPAPVASGGPSAVNGSYNNQNVITTNTDYSITVTNNDIVTTTTSQRLQSLQKPAAIDHHDIIEKYFRQLEEIKTLKEQLSFKDKKIRRLEDQLNLLRTFSGNSAVDFIRSPRSQPKPA